ncbi:membrane hypothetical protein [Nostocoides jenkinsii Ben 74]|uniref:Uncharacterized protein n=1 Tax=Nostocoides jenkinsii Ben 74 TaxID=1193518 RepID=A0A077M7D7_9MICO|nr:membrane hypothetical protein [Tetrasphaera jenkinsii Ben 74]
MTQGRGGPRATLVAIGSGSSLGMTASAIALAVLLRRAWGAASLAGLGAVLVRSGMAALVAVLLLRLGLGHVWPGPGAVGVALVRGGLAGLVAALVVLAAAPGGARAALRDGVRA